MFRRATFIAFVMAFLFSFSVYAGEEEGKGTPLPVPRFVTLGADEVNLRTGPGTRYPIRLVITKEGLPVEIIREFDVWRQIRDLDGDEGWVLKSMLSGKRAVIVKGSSRTLLKSPEEGSRPVAKVEPGVVAALKTCRKDWCHVSVAGFNGWLKRNSIWGVYPAEKFGG
jgi:SH3-like domain-containing protein